MTLCVVILRKLGISLNLNSVFHEDPYLLYCVVIQSEKHHTVEQLTSSLVEYYEYYVVSVILCFVLYNILIFLS